MGLAIEDSVKVFLRVRPSDNEAENLIDEKDSTEMMIVIDKTPYTFDHVFYSASTQSEVFHTMVEPQIGKLIQGFNCSILAYGQSGAGKTSTLGFEDQDNDSTGMVGMAIAKILEVIDGRENCEVTASFIEIYNEKVYDLLSDKCQESIYSKGTKYQGSIQLPISNLAEGYSIVQRGSRNRHVRATNLNSHSSRSHAMFSIFVSTQSESSKISAVMHICDLAGSEGLRNTNHTGAAQLESVNINRGLLAVSKVVQALKTGKTLIPYRDSVLTVVLQDSLNAHSYINILGCISTSRKDKSETMSTIRFAQSVKMLDNKNVPEFNSFLSQKQSNSVKTPLRPYMLPLVRNDLTKTPAKSFGTAIKHLSTIKKRPLAQANNFQSLNSTSKSTMKTPMRKTEMPRPNEMSYMQQTAGSIDNNTFNVLNFSTSTEVDTAPPQMSREPSQCNITSFSPVMRGIQQMIDDKFSDFMKTFIDQRESKKIIEKVEPYADSEATLIVMDDTVVNEPLLKSGGAKIVTSTVQRRPLQPRLDLINSVPRPTPSKQIKQQRLTKKVLETTSIPSANVKAGKENDSNNENDQTVIAKTVRRSHRISMIHERRRTSLMETLKPQSKKKTSRLVNVSQDSKPISKAAHKKKVLLLMNTGKFKELTLLPTIGAKTAYQIITHRSVNGKFKSIDDMKNLQALKGKKWQKFLEANMLI